MWRMTIFTLFFSLSWLQVLNLPALLQNKNTWIGPFPWKQSVLQNPDREWTNQNTGICLELSLPYNNNYYYWLYNIQMPSVSLKKIVQKETELWCILMKVPFYSLLSVWNWKQQTKCSQTDRLGPVSPWQNSRSRRSSGWKRKILLTVVMSQYRQCVKRCIPYKIDYSRWSPR